jgi:hypothetical protein
VLASDAVFESQQLVAVALLTVPLRLVEQYRTMHRTAKTIYCHAHSLDKT